MTVEELVALLRETDPGPPPVTGWRVIPPEVWARCEQVAAERDAQKRGFASSRYWNPAAHLVGLLGEHVYAEVAGLEVDLELRLCGDGGRDFPDGVDVKTTTHQADPFLRHRVDARHWPRVLALVAVDLERRRGRYCGHLTGSALRACPVEDFGHGPVHVAREPDLVPELPRA